MTRYVVFGLVLLTLVGAIFLSGVRYGTDRMQAALDAQELKLAKAAADKRMALDAMEAKNRAEAQAWEDRLNAVVDTGTVCIEPGWVR